MSTVRYKATFRPARSATEAPLLAPGAPSATDLAMSPNSGPAAPTAPVSRTARMLALAYRVHHMVETGELRDYATAAKRLGITRARMSQILAMLNLAAPLQEVILMGRCDLNERQLRRAYSEPDWHSQLSLLGIAT